MSLPMRPMLASPGDALPDEDGWRYEVKWDGIRAIVAVEAGQVRVWSRHGTVLTNAFPELSRLTDAVDTDVVLDGELVVCDDDGRPDFRRVRRRMALTGDRVAFASATDSAMFVAFDVLRRGGEDLTGRPWSQRRRLLTEVLPPVGSCWMVNPAYGDGAGLWEATRVQELEGLVAKREDATYRAGRRSNGWLKFKHIARTALPIVDVRDDAVLVAEVDSLRPVAWVDRFHPGTSLTSIPKPPVGRSRQPVGLCVVEHLAAGSGGLREPVVVALKPLGDREGRETISGV